MTRGSGDILLDEVSLVEIDVEWLFISPAENSRCNLTLHCENYNLKTAAAQMARSLIELTRLAADIDTYRRVHFRWENPSIAPSLCG